MRLARSNIFALFVSTLAVIEMGAFGGGGEPTLSATTAPSTTRMAAVISPLSPTMSQQDVLAYVGTARSKILDLTVSFSFDATQSGPDDATFRSHTKVAVKGSMLYRDQVYGGDPSVSPLLVDRELAYNGRIGTVHQKSEGLASFEPSRPLDCVTKGLGFFDLGFLNAPIKNGNGQNDQSLISLVGSSVSHMRPLLEIVGGHACYVFDVSGPGSNGGDPVITAWLDPQQGFLPIKVIYFMRSLPLMETEIDKSMQILPGLWLPLHGRKYVYFRKDNPYVPESQEHIMMVDGLDKGTPQIAVNTGVKDEYFDLWKHLPPGTLLIDQRTHQMVTVGGKDWRATADAAVAATEGQNLSVSDANANGSQDAPIPTVTGPGSNAWWNNSTLLEIASCVSVLGLFFAVTIFFRSKKA